MEFDDEAIQRGTELLLPFNHALADVQAVELAVQPFGNIATAKAWLRTHALPVVDIKQHRHAIHARVRSEDDFEPGTIRRNRIGGGIVVSAGVRKQVVVEEIPPVTPETPEQVLEIEVIKRGEIVILKDADGANPADEVRVYGIVMIPEVPDFEGDVTSEEEIVGANEEFMREFQTIGQMHRVDVSEKVALIQDVIAPITFDFPLPDGTSKTIAKGTWYQQLYSNDPEIVGKIRNKQLNGLSIGGTARRVPVEGEAQKALAISKRVVNKAAGDPAKNRFVNLHVREVSLVDAAGNEEDFFIVKRRSDMDVNTEQVVTTPAAPTVIPAVAETTPAAPTPPTKSTGTVPSTASTGTAPVLPVVAENQPVVTPVATPVATPVPPAPVVVQASVPSAVDPAAITRAVAEAMAPVIEKLNSLTARVGETEGKLATQQEAIGKAEQFRAVAKGTSIPDVPAGSAPAGEPVSKWAGTAVHQVIARKRA